MIINEKKIKTMIINFTENCKFTTRLQLKGENIEVVNSTRLLGTMLTDDLWWDLNTATLVKKQMPECNFCAKLLDLGPL